MPLSEMGTGAQRPRALGVVNVHEATVAELGVSYALDRSDVS